MPGIHPDITSAFGDTPLVRLNRVAEGVQALARWCATAEVGPE